MVGARLIGTKLGGAVLSEADLRSANLSCVNATSDPNCLKLVQSCAHAFDVGQCLKLAQAPGSRPAGTPPAPGAAATPAAPAAATPTTPTAAAGPKADACTLRGTGPKLDNARLSEAILTKANLSDGSLRSVDFTKVKDFTEAKFIGADLTEAVFSSGPTEEGLTLTRVDFSNACLCGANLRNANLEDATLAGATLRNADLRGATLPANLERIDFSGANIKGTLFKGDPPILNYANLTDVTQDDNYRAACKPQTR